MESRESHRKLAAIVFTDIVGYTSMMQRDENVALSAVRKHHEALQKCVPFHGGDIHHYTGDGSLSIFNSATDAIECALEFQKYLLQEPMVPVRIGIHIGEIYSEEGKIFGDGVNIASRIESIGQGGTVLFSRDVYEKIRNRPEFQMRSIGSFEFKNVDDPVEVFALTNPEIRTPDLNIIEGKLKEQPKKKKLSVYLSALGIVIAILTLAVIYLYPKDAITSPDTEQYKSSIAVLPFDNLSDNPEESSFLSTGLAEDILTQLAQIEGLKVISRSSSMKYKDYEADNIALSTIAEKLGVTNILEGSVRKYGNQLRINVRLINPNLGNVIWAQEFDRELDDVLNLQRDVALAISEKLQLGLTSSVKTRLEDEKPSVNPEAYVNYLKGLEVLHRTSGSQEDISQARAYFEASIRADSSFSKAWVGLADACVESVFWHRAADGDMLPLASRAIQQALSIDSLIGEAYGVLGAIDLFMNKPKAAERNLNRSIELSPSYAFAYERLAWVMMFTRRGKEAFEQLEKVIQLDPMSTRWKGSLGNAYYFTEDYDKGIARMREFLEIHPGDNFILWSIAYLSAAKGDYRQAIAYLDQRTIKNAHHNWVYAYCYWKQGDKAGAKRILDYLEERKKTSFVPDFMMAVVYLSNEMPDKAIESLDHATRIGGESYFAFQLGMDPMFASLRGDPRFQKIVDRIEMMYSD